MQPTREEIINELVQQPYLRRYQDIENKREAQNNGQYYDGRRPQPKKKENPVKNLIPASKRLTITYVVFAVWIGLAVFGILMNTDLISLSVYFASGMPLIIGYLWSETSRPSGSIKDVSKLVESMRGQDYWVRDRGGGFERAPGEPYGGYGGYGGGGGYHGGYHPGAGGNQQQQQQTTVIIISDDNSEKLEMKENELDTLINSGYVSKTKGKYTFRKEKKEEIVSLIDGQELKEDGIYAEEEASI